MLIGIVLTYVGLKSISVVTCKEPKNLLFYFERDKDDDDGQ